MPVHDYECACGLNFEAFKKIADPDPSCPQCGSVPKRLVTCTGFKADESDWIKSVREVVDPDGGNHCKAFLKDPTRSNYKNWKRIEGVRHLEPGEKIPGLRERERENDRKISEISRAVMKKQQKDKTIAVSHVSN